METLLTLYFHENRNIIIHLDHVSLSEAVGLLLVTLHLKKHCNRTKG